MADEGGRKSCVQRMLGPDRPTRVRVSMAATAGLLSVLCGGVVVLLGASGYGTLKIALSWLGLSAIFNLVVLTCIRAGKTRALADPALTQLQIWFAIASNAVGYATLGEARGLTPVILSLILMFGVFALSPRQMAANLIFSVASFGAAFGVAFWQRSTSYDAVLEGSYATLIFLVLLGSTFVGMRVQRVRLRLQEQKRALGEAFEKIQHLASHDELTGLANRRRMTQLIEAEQARCLRTGRPLMVALLDLDWFKQVNDSHGHAVGDEVLKAFTVCVSAQLRRSDSLARWGGEEFLLLMPEIDERGAVALMERVLQSVAALRVPAAGGEVSITASAGLSAGAPGESLPRLLEYADKALYDAKARGRACLVVHPSAHWQTDADNSARALDLGRRLRTQA